jgi:S-adenosylmethionine-diacylglycerol 3-amino-3-carboxypropyl transferase
MTDYIDKRANFGIIRYSNVWEDADVLCAALEPSPGKRILSIASAGDNALALLAAGSEVVAVDLSPAQLACVELRTMAFRELAYEELLTFLGVGQTSTESNQRLATYHKLAGGLSSAARDFWDTHEKWIVAGVIHAGKFEDYFRKFRTFVLPLVHGRGKVQELLQEKSEQARGEFYDRRWNTWRWRWLFRIFFSRLVMGRLGRDPEFFRYVEGSVADRILERTKYALAVLPTQTNPYLQYILTGNFPPYALPRYLRREYFDATRSGLDRLTLVQGSIEDAAVRHGDSRYDGYNLSDLFEYLDDATCRAIFERLLSVAKPAARLAYWNMLVPRQRPEGLADRIRPLTQRAEELFTKDLAFFYSRFVVEEVV